MDFAEYARELANELFRNYVLDPSQVRLFIQTEETPLEIDRAIPCGLILTELISNALKHAFPEGRAGELRVRLTRSQEGGVLLSVIDDGVGMRRREGPQVPHSMGLRLVDSLASQLNARIEFLPAHPGTEARLTLEEAHVHSH